MGFLRSWFLTGENTRRISRILNRFLAFVRVSGIRSQPELTTQAAKAYAASTVVGA